jgi:dCTP diphosphatase
MNEIKKLSRKVKDFRDARDWKQYHKPKDIVLSILIEAGELAEHFQWKNEQEISAYLKKSKNAVADELSDVLYFVLLLAMDLDINLVRAFGQKMKKNERKYPVLKARGKHTKYNQL